MREILFHGKRVDNGEWVEGIYLDQNHLGVFCYDAECQDYDITVYIVLPETVGQYTGLTDKNGKKIFEGDIVKWRDSSSNSVCNIGEIYYDNRGYYYVRNTFYGYETDPLLESGQCEIIGNIHDNPELLKGGENNETPH